MKQKENKKTYSVWIGGVEINDYYLTKEEAENIAKIYDEEGYWDIVIENTESNY